MRCEFTVLHCTTGTSRADKKDRGTWVKDVDLKEYEEEAAYLRSLKTLDSYVDTGLFSKR